MQANGAIELKDAQQNVLLGQYHMHDSSFVAAKLPRTGRPPASETVRLAEQPQPAHRNGSGKQELF